MCRGSKHVEPHARPVLAALLDDLAHMLADRDGAGREHVLVGPVDLGGPEVANDGLEHEET